MTPEIGASALLMTLAAAGGCAWRRASGHRLRKWLGFAGAALTAAVGAAIKYGIGRGLLYTAVIGAAYLLYVLGRLDRPLELQRAVDTASSSEDRRAAKRRLYLFIGGLGVVMLAAWVLVGRPGVRK